MPCISLTNIQKGAGLVDLRVCLLYDLQAGADSLVYERKAGSSGYNIKLHTSLYYHLQVCHTREVAHVVHYHNNYLYFAQGQL